MSQFNKGGIPMADMPYGVFCTSTPIPGGKVRRVVTPRRITPGDSRQNAVDAIRLARHMLASGQLRASLRPAIAESIRRLDAGEYTHLGFPPGSGS